MANSVRPDSMTSMWTNLQKHYSFPNKSSLMISCETELFDLMKELDFMVQKKQQHWEQQTRRLQAELDVKQNELTIVTETLENKNREIGKLRHSVESLDQNKAAKLKSYENEVTELRKQLSHLKKCFEKVQKKHKQYAQKVQHSAAQQETTVQDSMLEVQRLSEKVEDYKSKSREWEAQRISYQQQIANLESQRKTLAEKCDLIKHQSVMYKSQLESRKDMLDSTEMTLRAQVTQLEGQVLRDKDTMTYQEDQLNSLKKEMKDVQITLKQTHLIKDRLAEDIEEVNSDRARLEDDARNVNRELKYCKENMKISSDRVEELERQLIDTKTKIRQKTSQYNKLGELNALQESEQVKKLLSDLQNLQMNNITLEEQNRTLQSDIHRLTNQLRETDTQIATLNESLNRRLGDRNSDAIDARQFEAEVCRLRAKIDSMTSTQISQKEGMNMQLSNVTEELHQRNNAFASLTERLSAVEARYREDAAEHSKCLSELQLSRAQLDALRQENNHLKDVALSHHETSNDVFKFEHMLKNLETDYSVSVAKLQQENESLRFDINALRSDEHRKGALAVNGQDNTIKDFGHSHSSHAKHGHHKHHSRHHHAPHSVTESENQNQSAKDFSDSSRDSVGIAGSNVPGPRTEQTTDISRSPLVHSSPSKDMQKRSPGTHKGMGMQQLSDLTGFNSGQSTDFSSGFSRNYFGKQQGDERRASITTQFLEEEQQRAEQLQRNIDGLIDDFQISQSPKLRSSLGTKF